MKIAVAGCSFAGLSFSLFLSKLKGNEELELFDRKPKIGINRTSACCTSVKTIKEISAEKSILRRLKSFTFHFKKEAIEIRAPEFATFDYQKMCEIMASKIDGKFNLGKSVDPEKLGRNHDLVIDATGWSSKIQPKKKLAFGVEKEIEIRNLNPNTFHVFVGNDNVEKGYGWAFPVSESVFRIGIGSCKKIDYMKKLDEFIEKFDHGKDLSTTGGFMAAGLSKVISKDNIICLGDSASQILPLSFEGIRPIIYLARFLSEQVNDYSCEKLSLESLKNSYVEHSKKAFPYSKLNNAQRLAVNVNDATFVLMKPLMRNGDSLIRKYLGE